MLVALCCLVLTPRSAGAIVGDSDEAFGLDGSFTALTAISTPLGFPKDFVAFSNMSKADGLHSILLRLSAEGYAYRNEADDELSVQYEVHLLNVVQLKPRYGISSGGNYGSSSRGRALDTRWRWADESGTGGLSFIDRANVKLTLPFVDITVGRQAITFGKAYFWNPLDVFRSFGATDFDREYKAGVDALRADVPIGDFSGLTLVAQAGLASASAQDRARQRWFRSSLLLRGFTTVEGWDIALQGGKIHGAYQLGGALAGEWGPVEMRAEVAYFRGLDSQATPLGWLRTPRHMEAVFGVSRLFSNGFFVSAEYLFNSVGRYNLTDRMALVFAGRLLQASEHVVGTVVSYDISPLVTLSLASIAGFNGGPSGLFQPGALISMADEVELLLGGVFTVGRRPALGRITFQNAGSVATIPLLRSEFGSYPQSFYVQMKGYF